MKIRNGFVSNSSSSSFICEISGHERSGYDLCLEDAGMIECQNGHTFCDSYATEFDFDYDTELTEDEVKQIIKDKNLPELSEKSFDDFFSSLGEWRYQYPTEWCPICGFKHLTDSMARRILLSGSSEEQILDQLKAKYGNYRTFLEETEK